MIGDDDDEAARWAAFADQGPRWRDQSGDWDGDEADGVAPLGAGDDFDSPLGALDTTERPSDEEFLTFDDLEVPQQPLPTAPARGSFDDPIRISSEPTRAPDPPAPEPVRRADRRGRCRDRRARPPPFAAPRSGRPAAWSPPCRRSAPVGRS